MPKALPKTLLAKSPVPPRPPETQVRSASADSAAAGTACVQSISATASALNPADLVRLMVPLLFLRIHPDAIPVLSDARTP
jgi:hypothetical protein